MEELENMETGKKRSDKNGKLIATTRLINSQRKAYLLPPNQLIVLLGAEQT